MAEQSDFAKAAAVISECLKELQAMQERIVETVREIQTILLFGDHPELTALDDELDTMYRGQL